MAISPRVQEIITRNKKLQQQSSLPPEAEEEYFETEEAATEEAEEAEKAEEATPVARKRGRPRKDAPPLARTVAHAPARVLTSPQVAEQQINLVIRIKVELV